jgi:glycerol-3-phosphate acyltransferase PlsY
VVFDIAKGAIPAVVGRFVFDDYGAAGAGAAAAIVGHVYPVFAGFRGGRGLASAFGGVLALTPLIGVALPVVAVVIIGASRYMSLMSVLVTPLAAIAIIAAAFAGRVPWAVVPFAVFATVFILYTHLPNIRRLLAGTEPKIGRGGDRAATG